MSRVFISYSHKDEEWKDRLVSHLGVLEKENQLSVWTDRKIQGGEDWYPEIEKAIGMAQVAILMISANFLTSDFILKEEIPRLLKKRREGGMKILPLIMKPCVWNEVKWLSSIQVRPLDGRALSGGTEFQIDTDLTSFAKEVNDILKDVHEQTEENEIINYFPKSKIDLAKLPDTNATLFGRESEMRKLDAAWENPQTRIISLIAWGGVGKSALTNAWLNEMSLQNFKDAEQIYGWSFYSQGTKEDTQVSADQFLNDALRWFGYVGELPRSQFEKGRLLAVQIAKKKTLLILDGLEPLQYPPGEMYGRLKDQAMIALLKGLRHSMNGLCIITSRVKPTDLKSTEGRMTRTHELENLGDDAGMLLLKSYQLKGPEGELKKTSREFKGHALALNLLGSYLKTVHDGDIRKRDLIPALMEEEKNGGHARRVMESYERWFEEGNRPELDILYLLGLFDRPVSKEAIDMLKSQPAIQGLTSRLTVLSFQKWRMSLQNLRDLRLIAKKEDNIENLDCHPLIREHFGEKLQEHNPDAWKEAHSRLYEYYKNIPEKELPNTLEEMEPLFAAVRHGCLAGRYQEAMKDVYYDRIRRKNKHYILNNLGAFGTDFACLSAFFESPWEKPIAGFSDTNKAVLLSWAGFALRALGRLSEAVRPMNTCLKIAISNEEWKSAAVRANNLSELLLIMGDVQAAKEYANQSVAFVDLSGDDFQMQVKRASLAGIYFQAGNFNEAESLFREAENMNKKKLDQYPFLYSFPGFLYCDFLIYCKRFSEVLKRSESTLEIAKRNNWLTDIALDKISIGRALMFQSLQNKSDDINKALDYLNQAVEGLRNAGHQDDMPRGLYARTCLSRHQHNFLAAWTDLDEAREIVEYGRMKLYRVDYYLEACRVINAQLKRDGPLSGKYEIIENGEVLNLSRTEIEEKFKLFFNEAEYLISQCGYHLRDGELEELRELSKSL
ncbi:MAG: TIR domain-containing protein [Bacteroidota bacterium]